MDGITLEYEKIDPLTTVINAPMVEYAKTRPNMLLFLIRFTYYGHSGRGFTLVSKELVEDPLVDLGEMLMDQITNYAEDNPPPSS